MLTKYKSELNFARIRKLTSSLLTWVEKMTAEKICLCESVGKLKGIGNQGYAKMNEMNIHTISNL